MSDLFTLENIDSANLEENDRVPIPTKKKIFYLNFNSMLKDGYATLNKLRKKEIRKFRTPCVLTSIFHLGIPIILIVAFLACVYFYPYYTIWFSWACFLVLIYTLYRFKDFCILFYYLNNINQYKPDLPTYSEHTNSQELVVAPPPTYQNAQSTPPPYICRD